MTWLALFLLATPLWAREPCPPLGDEGVSSRGDVLQSAQRALEGYRARDVRVVDAARCDIEAALPRLTEELGPADAGRIHLAYAVAAQITGEPEAAVGGYLASARAADAYLDEAIEGLVGEDDVVVGLYRAMAASGATERVFVAQRLPPAWSGDVLVNGKRDSHARVEPYVLQLVGRNAQLDRSFYVEAGAAPPRYLRKRPVIGGMMLGSAAVGAASLTLGGVYLLKGTLLVALDDFELEQSQEVSGADLAQRRDDLQAEVDSAELRGNVALGTAGAFGLVTLGLGVWYVTTF